ncbi:hypothetical protein GCM10023238_03660 [Streptomyces heliomycini]
MRRGLLWLAIALVAVLFGAPVIRGVFTQLAGLTEPLRDGLVRRAVEPVPGPGRLGRGRRDGPGGRLPLTNQVEIARTASPASS